MPRKIAGLGAALMAVAALALAPSPALAAMPWNSTAFYAPLSADSKYLGVDTCSGATPTLYVRPGSESTGYDEWFVTYTTVAQWNGSAYVPDTTRWQGPVWGRTSNAGWLWYNGRWQAQTSLWLAHPLTGARGYYRGYQYIKYQTSGRVRAGLTSNVSFGRAYCSN